MTLPRTIVLAGGVERHAGMLRARLTAADLANEVAARDLDGLQMRVGMPRRSSGRGPKRFGR